MNKYIYFPFLFFLIVISNCNIFLSNSDECEKLKNCNRSRYLIFGKVITIGFNQTISSLSENVSISFDSIGVDSRCPVNVMCVWEGNAELVFSLFNNDYNNRFVLNTNPSFTKDTIIQNYHIKLIDLFPDRHTDCQFTDRDYSAELIILK